MKRVLIIGSGIAGLSCAVSCAEKNMDVTLVSPFPSERAQSVLAAGVSLSWLPAASTPSPLSMSPATASRAISRIR